MEKSKKKVGFDLKPELIFLIFGIIFGLIFCIFIPYGAGFDEEAHVVRTFDISGLNFIPNKSGEDTFSQFYLYSYQRRNFQNPAFDQFNKQPFLEKAYWNNMTTGTTRSTYFPANYILPAVVAGFFLRVLDFPFLPALILMRLIGFAFYLFAGFQAIRMLKIGKWVFLVTALTPMALFQVGTLNTDGFTLAISYLLIGVVFKIFFTPDKTISLEDALKLALVSILVGCAKPGTILLLLLILILIRNKPKSKLVPFIIIAGILLSFVISIAWMFTSTMNAHIWTGDRTFGAQLKIVLANLPDFLLAYLRGIFVSIPAWYTGWIGVYGYWLGKVPSLVYILFPIALLAALFTEGHFSGIKTRSRVSILIIAIVCLAGIASFQFISFYVPGGQVSDKVGRYFLPFSSLIFISISAWIPTKEKTQKTFRLLTVLLALSTVISYTYGLYRTYYSDCVYEVNAAHPCVLPQYKNLDVSEQAFIANVTNQNTVDQSFKPLCDELTSVFVRVQDFSGKSDEKLVYSLLDENKNIVSSKEYPFSTLKKIGLLELPVNIKVKPNETVLWLQLTTEKGDSPDASISLLGRADRTVYPDGILLFNRTDQNGDLFFQYTCKNPPKSVFIK